MKIINGDCFEIIKTLASNSTDAIVTDPPYELGIMGKKWDKSGIAYRVDLWQEVLRVLKPGGHLLSFGGSRTYHRMACAIEDAGFEIRDQIMWVYGNGWPKSLNIGKINKKFKGRGTALKPSHEPIVLARKSLSEKTIIENILKYGTGGLNIDECRVPLQDNKTILGRFPANFIHDGSDEVEDIFARVGIRRSPTYTVIGKNNSKGYAPNAFGKESREAGTICPSYGDSGSAMRYYYCAKVSKSERGEGNNHPTVKPFNLMKHLITLVTPPDGTVLDPFMGSGTTGLVCKYLNLNFIGIEKDKKYYKIAPKRIKNQKAS